MMEQENAIKLIQDGVMFQRIKNSGLSYNNIKELQRLRDEKLVKLRAERYERAIKLVGSLNNEQELNNLYSEITKDDILTDLEKYNIKRLIENKINLLRQKIEFEFLKDRISKERDLTKLSVDWNNAIIEAKYQNANQKNELEMIRLERIKELRGLKAFEDIKKAIENEGFLSNLLDGKVHQVIIDSNLILIDNQNRQLHESRKENLKKLANKLYDDYKNIIKNERISSKLEDKGYHDDRIKEIPQEFLTDNRNLQDLQILRRYTLDKISSKTDDELYDTNNDLIDFIQNLNEISDNSEIANDILKFNQTLLTGNRRISDLDNKRKTRYNDGLYDIIEAEINNEEKIKRLQEDLKIKIDTEVNKDFISSPRTLEKLHQLREARIKTLQQPQ